MIWAASPPGADGPADGAGRLYSSPVGHYTIDAQQAHELVRALRPRVVVLYALLPDSFGFDVIAPGGFSALWTTWSAMWQHPELTYTCPDRCADLSGKIDRLPFPAYHKPMTGGLSHVSHCRDPFRRHRAAAGATSPTPTLNALSRAKRWGLTSTPHSSGRQSPAGPGGGGYRQEAGGYHHHHRRAAPPATT